MAGILRSIISIFFFFGLFASVSSVNAQDELVHSISCIHEFGEWLQISGKVDSNNVPQSITLFLQPENQTNRQIEIIPDSNGTFLVRYDLNQDPLSPFSRVYYWFLLNFSDGTNSTTSSFWFDYVDNRYEWRSTSSRLFNVYWTSESTDYGQKVIDIATRGLEKATGILAVAPELPIKIYIYPDSSALQEALSLSHQPWTAGHASPELGVVLVSNEREGNHLFELERQIPHELMHILIFQASGANYSTIPVWLSEGLATYAETYPNPDLERALIDASSTTTLIPLDSLCLSFPRDAQVSQLAYAQSLSVVKYLEDTYGKSIFTRLIDTSAERMSCTQLVKSVSGLSLYQLERDWWKSISPVKHFTRSTFFLLSGLVATIIGIFVVLFLIRKKQLHPSPNGKNDR